MSFHANFLHCLLGKIRDIFKNVVCWKMYPACKMLNSQQVYAVKLNETVWPSPMSHWTDELKIPFVLKLPRFITSQRDHTVKAIAAVITYWWLAVIRGQICSTPYQKGKILEQRRPRSALFSHAVLQGHLILPVVRSRGSPVAVRPLLIGWTCRLICKLIYRRWAKVPNGRTDSTWSINVRLQ